jgi:uncharacterized ferritin-like protein (DUF455 family)
MFGRRRSEQKDFNSSRLALIHSLAHIESYAIDLSWDILVRFAGGVPASGFAPVSTGAAACGPSTAAAAAAASAPASAAGAPAAPATTTTTTTTTAVPAAAAALPTLALPLEYFTDWLRVAGDECRHFAIWAARLQELGASYGCLPVHDALWQSAGDTKQEFAARLSVVHMVHEARSVLDAYYV